MDIGLRLAVFLTETALLLLVLVWIRRSERRHALPWSFLFELLLWGGVTAIIAATVELRYALTPSQLQANYTPLHGFELHALQSFVPGLVEELAKYAAGVFAVLSTKHAHRFSDTVLYFILIGLGFSLIEDIFFLLNPATIAPFRLMSFYVHAGTGAIIGYGFARFKFGNAGYGQLLGALGTAVLLHGFYNLSVRPAYITWSFPIALILTLTISWQVYALFRRALQEDHRHYHRAHRLHHRYRHLAKQGI